MKYNFDTILKDFKYETKKEVKEDDSYTTCIICMTVIAIVTILVVFL